MVVTAQRAATIGEGEVILLPAISVAVPMAAEDGLQAERFEPFEKVASVGWTVTHVCAQGEMREDDRRFARVEFRPVFIKPLKRGRLNRGLLVALPLRGIQSQELPAIVLEGVVKAARKNAFVSSAVRVGPVVVVADLDMDGDTQGSENVPDHGEISCAPVFCQISAQQHKGGPFAAKAANDHLQPGAAFVTHTMEIVEDDEAEPWFSLGCGMDFEARRTQPAREEQSSPHPLQGRPAIELQCPGREKRPWFVMHDLNEHQAGGVDKS